MKHTHDLDGSLHDDCPMCELIEERRAQDRREQAALAALDLHTERAAIDLARRAAIEADMCRWCGHHETWHRADWGCDRTGCPCPIYKGGPS